ncbi:MAG: helix-turn-helix domain-containing protein, partial [Clostridia bacterium]|nr:helix-turn-helix domain-containing protein [Clostridia bacterium]
TACKFDHMVLTNTPWEEKEKEYTLRWMMHGEAELTINGERFELRTGEVVIAAPNTEVVMKAKETKNISYAKTFFSGDLSSLSQIVFNKPFPLYGRAGEILLDYFYAASQVFGDAANQSENAMLLQYCKTALEMFLLHLHLSNSEDRSLVLPEQMKTSTHASDRQLTEQIKNYLSAHLSESITLEMLSKDLGVGQNTALRVFRQDVGMGIMTYFTKLRIDEAIRLICDTDLSFRSISERLGFESPEYFSRVFKRVTGLTPTEFSKQQSKWKGCLAGFFC